MALIFWIGAVLLLDAYGKSVDKPTTWTELFLVVGSLTVIIDTIFIAWLLYTMASRRTIFRLERYEDSLHTLHTISVITAAASILWSILALALTFAPTLVSETAGGPEIAGYFMVGMSLAYNIFLVVRAVSDRDTPEPEVKKKTDTSSLDYMATQNAIRSAMGAGTFAQPIFGGGSGGAAAFGGIDLSGLSSGSSLSALPPTQQACQAPPPQYWGGGGGYPMMMPMMMPPQQPVAACAVDPNSVRL